MVTARATIPFKFWAQAHEFQAGDHLFDNAVPGSASIRREGTNLLDEDSWEGMEYKVNVREQEATAHRSVDRRRKKAHGKHPAAVG